jgi:putative flippase GtrA
MLGFAKLVIAYLPNFAIQFSFVFIFINMVGWNKFLVYAFATALAIPITFLLVKFYAFRKGEM